MSRVNVTIPAEVSNSTRGLPDVSESRSPITGWRADSWACEELELEKRNTNEHLQKGLTEHGHRAYSRMEATGYSPLRARIQASSLDYEPDGKIHRDELYSGLLDYTYTRKRRRRNMNEHLVHLDLRLGGWIAEEKIGDLGELRKLKGTSSNMLPEVPPLSIVEPKPVPERHGRAACGDCTEKALGAGSSDNFMTLVTALVDGTRAFFILNPAQGLMSVELVYADRTMAERYGVNSPKLILHIDSLLRLVRGKSSLIALGNDWVAVEGTHIEPDLVVGSGRRGRSIGLHARIQRSPYSWSFHIDTDKAEEMFQVVVALRHREGPASRLLFRRTFMIPFGIVKSCGMLSGRSSK